jgi:hypothetical protein
MTRRAQARRGALLRGGTLWGCERIEHRAMIPLQAVPEPQEAELRGTLESRELPEVSR